MTSNSDLLKDVFKTLYPKLESVVHMTGDVTKELESPPYLSFEWIGLDDYLGETKRKPGARTRGAHYTSADFAFRFQRFDGKTQIVLGEWKYTEYYGREDKGENEVRLKNYQESFHRPDGIFGDKSLYRTLFYEPFYQLMRLQLLAQEMELNHEMGADIVSVLHVTPEANKEFSRSVHSPELVKKYPGLDVINIWKEIVGDSRFTSLAVEDLLHLIDRFSSTDEQSWTDWLKTRYAFGN
jgi:hypothetical protein